MRQEDIDFLIRANIPVTEYNIIYINNFNPLRESFTTTMSSGAIDLDIKNFNDMYNYATTLFKNSIDKKIPLRDRVNSILENINEDVDDIDSAMIELKEESASSSVLESAMSGELETILIDFSNRAIISNESEGIIIQNGLMFADATNELANKESIRIEKIKFGLLSSFMRSRQSVDVAKIEQVSDTGIGFFPDKDLDVINNDIPFRLEGVSDENISRKIDLLIDRDNSSLFNQVEIDLEKAHMVSVYTSSDNEEFTVHTNRPEYIKKSTIQITPTSDRYVKIVFHKLKHDTIVNGNNTYTITIKSLSLLRTTFEGKSVLITNPIQISGAYSKIAMNTCDCISAGEKGLIDYYLSVNGKDWESIRPVGRTSGDTLSKESVINVNPTVDNKFILLEDKEVVNNIETYTLTLPDDFVRSNYLRVFSEDITYSSEDWEYERSMYSAIGILYEEKVIDFGENEILLNGKWIVGEVKLMPNIYRIKIRADNYANVITDRENSIVDIGNGEYAVESNDGAVRTVFDPLYPYNHKYIIEKEFDYVFRQELIEKEDYNLYNKDSEYHLSTMKSHENIIIAYRLHQSSVNSIQLKAELRSEDSVTIPYIEKTIIRLA
ncbi:MAG: hypothetical protein DRQ78_00825 [Epsilonproteobacteria bacterium]|nr:MAG: hypothetical protein DRQ78_00825 [Campylobacterota bacterium]